VTDSVSRTSLRGYRLSLNNGGLSSRFVSQQVPGQVETGQRFTVWVSWDNLGILSWDEAGVSITSQNPPKNTTWGISQLFMPSLIPIGRRLLIGFPITAPARPGLYNMQWQLHHEAGGFFGDPTPNLTILVDDGVTPLVTKVKYKANKGKLIVTGRRLTAAVRVLVDGQQAAFNYGDESSLTAKRLNLSPGTHTVAVVGANGVSAVGFSFTVQ
jgi:hypothetical protein